MSGEPTTPATKAGRALLSLLESQEVVVRYPGPDAGAGRVSAHPLLLKLLRDAAAGSAQYADWLADSIPEDIADRLEAALDRCQWAGRDGLVAIP